MSEELLFQTGEIRPGDHLVALYRDEIEIERYVTTYIHSALSKNERCIYITGDEDTSAVLQQIKALSARSEPSGDLVIYDRNDTYSKEGKFNPDKLIDMIAAFAQTAVDDGYSGLAVTGEISWVLDYEDGEELIIEYEWKLNERIFGVHPVSALCRYNITRFSDDMVRNIIQLHPLLLWQNRIHENPYYIPPEGFKTNTVAKHQVDGWLHNIDGFTDSKTRFRLIEQKSQEDMRQLHRNMTNGIVTAFLKLMETHDEYTKGHCSNVASLAVSLARRLGASEEFTMKLSYAALVHDIGKTLIPKEVLNKPGRLTEEEYAQIKMHPVYGYNALSQLDQLAEIALAVRHHHERFDGKGYPDGHAGDRIPLMSRILAICDSYDAMTNDRPYRVAPGHAYALREITACASTQFDPSLVEHFVKLFPSRR
ncbi:MAG: HD domain-containing protein [Clostridiaceae bacterium]|nr:HD domain-containing protein [Clostridiaceae bacterium]